jgi:hypothetical protein
LNVPFVTPHHTFTRLGDLVPDYLPAVVSSYGLAMFAWVRQSIAYRGVSQVLVKTSGLRRDLSHAVSLGRVSALFFPLLASVTFNGVREIRGLQWLH